MENWRIRIQFPRKKWQTCFKGSILLEKEKVILKGVNYEVESKTSDNKVELEKAEGQNFTLLGIKKMGDEWKGQLSWAYIFTF